MRDLANESQREKLSSWLNSALQDDELYKVIPDGTWWYWLVLGGAGSVWGSTGWYLVVLVQ